MEAQEVKKQNKAKQVSAQKRESEWQERVRNFSSSIDDFEEVMEEAEDVEVSPALQEAIFDSSVGPQVLYELAKNPEEANRISKLSPIAAIREIGRIEGKLQASLKETPKKSTTTKAPRPLSNVRGSGKVSKDLNDPNLSQAQYEALRRKQSA